MNFFQKFYNGIALLHKMRNRGNEPLYKKGKFPGFLKELYAGSVGGTEISWKGKYFEKDTLAGINIFNDRGREKRDYPFKVYSGKGVYNPEVETLKIDYNIKKNSFLVRLILDELVEVDKGNYLGKVFLRIIPGSPLFLGYFHLQKTTA